MLAENKLDIVVIGTPGHWHALQTIDALKAGAHVYVQKPISVDVMEGEAMVAAARKYNKVVQVGTQRKSTPHLIEAKKKYSRCRPARQNIARGNVLLLPYARQRQSAGATCARFPGLRDVDRPGAFAPLRWIAARALVAYFPGIWQRHYGRYVHPHVRYGALDAETGLAQAD